MSVAPGDVILASDMNKAAINRRVGEVNVVANSANITSATATTVMTLVVNLVVGQTYSLFWQGRVSSTVAGDMVLARIKPTNSAGTDMNVTGLYIGTTSAAGFNLDLYAEFVAPSTGSFTFVVTLERSTGTGTVNLKASATGPAYFLCDYISG